MSRSFGAALNVVLIGLWCGGIVIALPGLAIMGLSARAGMWLTGESMQ